MTFQSLEANVIVQDTAIQKKKVLLRFGEKNNVAPSCVQVLILFEQIRDLYLSHDALKH